MEKDVKREEIIAKFDAILAEIPEIERKGKTMPYTSENTFMFSQVNKEAQVGIRLNPQVGADFITKHNSKPYESYGKVLKDWVLIPESLLDDTEEMKKIFRLGSEHVNSLKPNPRKKK